MNKRFRLLCVALFSLSPLVYLALVWERLPPQVPTHFDASGVPDDYSSRAALWALNGGISLLSIGMYQLFRNLHHIDPKRHGSQPLHSFTRLADGLVLFLTAINFTALLACTGHPVPMTRVIFPLIGLLFAFLGNVMYSIKPNYFAGIRLPWTLADDENWRATHRVAGIVWFACGLAVTICSLLIAQRLASVLLTIMMAPMIGIPVAYSFWHYKRTINKS